MPAWWTAPAVAVPWQVTLHSVLAAAVLLLWARRAGLAPGRCRRAVLGLVLVLPLLTTALTLALGTALTRAPSPGTALTGAEGGAAGDGGFVLRDGSDFRQDRAWFDSLRLLAVPIGPFHLYHGVLAVAAGTVLLSLAQELALPLAAGLRRRARRRRAVEPPPALVRRVRALPGWRRCRVEITPSPRLHAATGGRPGRPRLWLSEGVLELPPAELDAVLRHELAHWRRDRWWGAHGLYAARLVQLFNPVALWAFREHTVETEIACDAAAVEGRDPRPLARVLLRIYEESSTATSRSLLRRRVDVLLGRPAAGPASGDGRGEAVPLPAVAAAGGLLLVLLPWVV